jgi:hypothetical protein
MKFWIFVVVLMLLAVSVSAVQPTQNYLKLYMSPFYRSSMSQNTNYTYQVNITAPDGISSVSSAIVSLDVWISPTVTFYMWVNGQPCTTSNYTISTTYASAGRGVPTFDCTNRITKAGLYNVTVRPTQQNIGASTVWLDVTYMNEPSGSVTVSGTEYSPGDAATTFVQLKDNQGVPVQNGSCFLDIWYPLLNGTHPYTVHDAPMLTALGDDGIYYYDLVAPSILGVYMLSVRCAYQYNPTWIYRELESVFYPVRSIKTGDWQGSSVVLNSKADGLYERCDGSIALPCVANYTFNMTQYGLLNITSLNVYYMGQSDTIGRTLTLSYWNGTSFVNMTNTLTYAGTGGPTPTPYDELLSNNIPAAAVVNGMVIIGFNVPGSTRIFNDWLAILVLSSVGTVQDVKGNSEMHITNIANATLQVVGQVNNSGIAQSVWNATSRNLTYYANDSAVIAQINATVTNHTSMLNQLWIWVQGIFGWVQTDTDVNASTSVATNIPSSIIPQSVSFISSQYYMEQQSSVLAHVVRDGLEVTGAVCSLKVYYPNMSVFVSGLMSYSGIGGIYNFTWTPEMYGSHPSQVNCSGGVLSGQVSAASSLGVSAPSSGVVMTTLG